MAFDWNNRLSLGHVQDQMVSASSEDGAAGKNLETQGRSLFVGLERRI